MDNRKAQAIENLQEAVEAHGLGYALETGGLTAGDVKGHDELETLISTASEAIRKIRLYVSY